MCTILSKGDVIIINKENSKTQIIVKNHKISVITINDKEYISLTDLARYANSEEPKIPIQTWMRNKDVILYLGLWEKINNENFKGHEFTTFEQEAGKNSFYMSPHKWIKETSSIGIVSKSGNNGGTFAHSDIAFEFASWLSPEFKLYVIQEFQRLKEKETHENKLDWHANRILAKVNYVVHTDSIKNYIVPKLTEFQKKFVYSNEADVLNVALFGMTAKEWREMYPEEATKGNIRDYTDLLHLIILSNLENTNAEMISHNIPQQERLLKLNESARRQMRVLKENKGIKDLELLQKGINKEKPSLIENK